MSFRKRRRLSLSPEAKDDFEDILLYSLKSWGAEQQDAYKAAIDRALQSLREFPELGRARDDLYPGCRIHRVQQHYILYRIDDTAIRVVRILHVRRDLAGALNQ